MRLLAAAACLLALAGPPARAGDWPQWGGPGRDHRSTDTGLLRSWPEGGPPRAWLVEGLGAGHSSPAVANGALYVTGMVEKQGVLTKLDLDGKTVWRTPYGPEFTGNRPGARSSPAVHDGRVYLVSGLGRIVCVEARSGRLLWSVDAAAEYGAQPIDWGICESPLVDGDRLVCVIGGRDASVIALDRRTGALLWRTTGLSEKSAYSSAIVVQRGPARLVVARLATRTVALDARSGELLWSHPDESKNDVHGCLPVYHDGLLFTTNWDGTKGTLLEIAEDGRSAKVRWNAPDLACGYGGVVLAGGRLYGAVDVRGRWTCVEMATGKLVGATPGKGAIAWADGMLYTFDERGVIGLMRPGPAGPEPVSSFKIALGRGEFFSHPVIAGGRLYVRYADTLAAYRLR